jgi:drug/metabolite transporter (DMT)-like permease
MFLNIDSLKYGILIALIDSFTLSLLNAFYLGWINWDGIMIISMLLYSVQPIIFLKALSYNNLIITNLLWDIISIIIVTFIGLFYFNEQITQIKLIGIIFSFIGMMLLSYDVEKR